MEVSIRTTEYLARLVVYQCHDSPTIGRLGEEVDASKFTHDTAIFSVPDVTTADSCRTLVEDADAWVRHLRSNVSISDERFEYGVEPGLNRVAGGSKIWACGREKERWSLIRALCNQIGATLRKPCVVLVECSLYFG